MSRLLLGQQAEKLAEQYLRARGLRLMERNPRCRFGEIDLVMRAANTVVFVEVRARTQQNYGSAAESVDYRKQQKLIRTARFWLKTNPKYANFECRFDVMAIDSGSVPPSYLWYKDAFRLD